MSLSWVGGYTSSRYRNMTTSVLLDRAVGDHPVGHEVVVPKHGGVELAVPDLVTDTTSSHITSESASAAASSFVVDRSRCGPGGSDWWRVDARCPAGTRRIGTLAERCGQVALAHPRVSPAQTTTRCTSQAPCPRSAAVSGRGPQGLVLAPALLAGDDDLVEGTPAAGRRRGSTPATIGRRRADVGDAGLHPNRNNSSRCTSSISWREVLVAIRRTSGCPSAKPDPENPDPGEQLAEERTRARAGGGVDLRRHGPVHNHRSASALAFATLVVPTRSGAPKRQNRYPRPTASSSRRRQRSDPVVGRGLDRAGSTPARGNAALVPLGRRNNVAGTIFQSWSRAPTPAPSRQAGADQLAQGDLLVGVGAQQTGARSEAPRLSQVRRHGSFRRSRNWRQLRRSHHGQPSSRAST